MIEDDTFVIKGPPPLSPLPNISLGKLIYDNLIANVSENEALIDAVSEQSLSYKDLLVKTCSLAESLSRSGYGKNSIITICSENSIEFFIPLISALYIGATIAPLNHNYTTLEMEHSLSISQPNIIFCSQQVYLTLLKLENNLHFVEKIIIIDSENSVDGIDTINSFISKCLRGGPLLYEFLPVELDIDQHVAFIMSSSGTTGLPKGVMITHKNVLVRFMHYDDPRLVNQERDRCTLGILPFYHAYGLIMGLNNIFKQIKVIAIKKFNEELFLSSIEKYKITSLYLVPSLAIFLAKSPLVEKYNLTSIRELSCGAAPLSRATEELLKKRLNIKAVRQAYGLSETTIGVIGMPFGEEKFGSCGKVLPFMTCKVRDPETGKSLGPNQVGELCFKGPMVMKGYYRNEEATKISFTSDGWLLTGDLGYYDENEYFYIVDRLKELIKYKGFQVAPAELESILLTNPKINDVGVIGVPDEEAGELPMAFVVPNSNLTEDEVKQFLAEKVSPYKKLRGGVKFVNEIPKNPSGKILRRKLRELLNKKYKSKL